MPGYRVVITGDERLIGRLRQIGDEVPNAINRGMNQATALVQSYIMEQKLLGQVLNRRTGNLQRNIRSAVERLDDRQLKGSVYVTSHAPYARVHEYGGIVHVPKIVPVNKRALHFFVGSKEVFAMSADPHDVTMPQRSFMRTALAEKRDEAIEIFKKWISSLLEG